MRTVTYQSVLEGVLRRLGQEPESASLERLLQVNEAVADRYRDAVEYYRWPEFMRLEERYFRPAWTAVVYAAGAEVWHAATEAYYVTAAGALGTDVPGVAPEWAVITGDWHRYVAYEQAGQTPVGAVLGAWRTDPRSDPAALAVSFQVGPDGVTIPPSEGARDSVWLSYRVREEEYAWESVWAADATYAAGERVYFAPEVWVCLDAATAGQSPLTHAAKWRALEMPQRLARAIKAGARADLLGVLGQDEKESARAPKFEDLLEEQVWQLTKLQGQMGRYAVVPPA